MPKDFPTKVTFVVDSDSVSRIKQAVKLQPERTDIDWYEVGSNELNVYAYLTCAPDKFMARVYNKAKQLKE